MKKSEKLLLSQKSNVGRELRQIRQDKFLRQTDVARRVKCSSSNICQFEIKKKKGNRGTNMKMVLKYAKALGFKEIVFTV